MSRNPDLTLFIHTPDYDCRNFPIESSAIKAYNVVNG